jgi:hypothetical protein
MRLIIPPALVAVATVKTDSVVIRKRVAYPIVCCSAAAAELTGDVTLFRIMGNLFKSMATFEESRVERR